MNTIQYPHHHHEFTIHVVMGNNCCGCSCGCSCFVVGRQYGCCNCDRCVVVVAVVVVVADVVVVAILVAVASN